MQSAISTPLFLLFVLTLSISLSLGAACKGETREDPEPAEASAPTTIEDEPSAASAPSSQPTEEGAQAEQHEDEPSAAIDHGALDELLKAHVDAESGLVDYDGFKRDEAKLDAYLSEQIAEADLEALSEAQRFAFYVNAYNASTIKLILERYPDLKSIKDFEEPWKQERWEVGGETLSLDAIEHTKLRPVFKDPRIHFAVNCASIGCPPLRAEAYRADDLEAQLDAAARHTLTKPAYAEAKKGTLYVSSLLDWYGSDFTDPSYKGHAESLAQYVARYGSPEIVALVEKKGEATPVKFKDYDWALNKQP